MSQLSRPGGPGQCEPDKFLLGVCYSYKMVKMVSSFLSALPQIIKVMFQEEKMSVRSKVGGTLQREHKS